jgi:predicted ATPase/DNA-binding SARP family transcriptional activator/DNA-binding CsgD family transcriptional regulator
MSKKSVGSSAPWARDGFGLPAGLVGMTQPEAPTGKRLETVRVRLLGGFRVSVGSRTIEKGAWRLRKAAALVKLLALAPGHRLHREQVMDILLPDSGRKAASNNLRRVLHTARRVLDPVEGSYYLASHEESLVLCPGGDLWVDVDAFEEAARAARRVAEPPAYEAATDLYAGELLPEDRYEQWAENRREELRRLFLSLLVELAQVYEECGDYVRGIEALRRVISEEPTLEEAHAGLMRLYAFSGRRRAALQQYERLREALSRELVAQPAATTRRLHEDIAAGGFPPLRPSGPPQGEPPDAGKHNLPIPRTSFVGRERELVEVKRQLAMTRLLTLTGAGGSGKTRLALEVAKDLVMSYPDGVWLTELAPLTEGELVPHAVTRALGVREQPGRPLTETLVAVLRHRDMLLVLDNCEHLADPVARLLDTLLDACSRVRVLTTSRETLGVEGEAVWRVSSLSVPDTDRLPAAEEMARYDAMRLFLDRARLRVPGFNLTPDKTAIIAEVCQKLDGIPLAIELAAAKVKVLSVGQIARRLDDSLGLLTSGSRVALPRHRTLRGTLDWSHALLPEEERMLFRRLSVFVAGFALGTAERICTGDGLVEEDVLGPLSCLVDKSLVLVIEGEEEARYRLLATVRQYAEEKLRTSGEEVAVRSRHARFYLELAKSADSELTGAGQEAWLDRLEAELANIRAALRWFLESGEPGAETGLRLAGALWRFCWLRGHYDEGRGWLEEALALGRSAESSHRAKALTGAGVLALLQCNYGRAEARLEESLALYRELGDLRGVASALQFLGSVARERGRYTRAEAYHVESLALWRELGDDGEGARSLNSLGFAAWLQEKYDRVAEVCTEPLKMFRRLGDVHGSVWALINLGSAALYGGDLGRAEALLEESLVTSRRAGYSEGVAWSLNQLGVAAYRRGDHERAEALLRESLRVHHNLGDRWRISSVLEGLAEVACTRGHLERTARLFGAAETLRETIAAPIPPCERADHDRNVSVARAGLGEEVFARARARGRAMTLDVALQYALSDQAPTTVSSPTRQRPSARRKPAALTRREEEISALVAQGLTNREVASELVISEHTAATHVRKILKKLGLHSRAELDAWMSEWPSSSDLDK